jgi:ribosomal protein S18 acetylase RimI-like enzyme
MDDVTSVRPYVEDDQPAVMQLALRLTAGAAPWRDPDRWVAVVLGWVAESIAAEGSPGHALFVAEDGDRVVGFVALSTRTHFTGDVDAYIGHLVVDRAVERRGVGRRLLQEAEDWARVHGFETLTLDTGARNIGARALYESAGFEEEDIRLSKRLG